MLYYMLVILSALCYAVQFAANKTYQTKKGSAVATSLKFLALKGAVAAVVFFFVAWIINGSPMQFHPMSVMLACIASVMGCTCFILGFIIFKYGSMSVFSTFLMIGGMTLPFVYSALRGEQLGVFKIIGIVLLIFSLVLSLVGKGKGDKKNAKSIIMFVLLCGFVFLCNGGMSVFSSIHSGEDFEWFTNLTVAKMFPEISRERVEGVEFTVLVNMANAVLCSIALGVVTLVTRGKKGNDATENTHAPQELNGMAKRKLTDTKIYPFVLIFSCAMLDAFAFVLMRVVDASGQIVAAKYPMQTAFTVVLSAVAGYIAFKEKPNKWGMAGLILTFLSSFLFVI